MGGAAPSEPTCDATAVPRHVAIIMDGNGRWAKRRAMPRAMGHQRGVEAVRKLVRAVEPMGIECLTLYAFSSGELEAARGRGRST